MEECLKGMADRMSDHGGFEAADTERALERSYKFFIDRGKDEAAACDDALDLVSRAMEAAPRFGFGLPAMLDHILLSYFHRVPRSLSFIE